MTGDRDRVGGRVVIEVCVDSAAGVAEAVAGGADRIELCSALEIGGLTPGAGLVARARAATAAAGVGLFAMVRPRGGGFDHDAGDLAAAIDDARALVVQGVDGLVFGATRGGKVDVVDCCRWIGSVRDAAGHAIPCTFHRAIDVVADPVAAVDVVAALGFDRILTSGGQTCAIDGAETIAAMVARAGDRMAIVAGSGVAPGNVAALVTATGVREVHASASRPGGPVDPRLIELGFASATRRTTDAPTIRALRSALDNRNWIGH